MSKGGGNNMQWIPTVTNQQTSTNTNQNTNTQQQSQTNQTASQTANGLSSQVGGSSGLSLNQIPVWLEQASQAGVQNAGNLLQQGITPYAGQLTAGMNDVQNAVGNAYQNLVGSAQPYYDAAGNAISGAMQQGPQVAAQTYANGLQNIGNYMNPYINNVVNSVSQIGQQNLNNALNQTHDQAISANAFGGSRQGVQEGVATAQNNLNTNNLIANLLNSGYNQATSLLGADISNNLTSQQNNQNAFQNYMGNLLNGGNALSNLGTTASNTMANQLNNVMGYGNQQQTTQQAADTAGYNNYQYLNNMPQQLQQLYNQTVSSAPHSTAQSTSGTQYANGATSQTGTQQGQSNTTASSQSNTTGSSNSNTSGTSMQQQQMPTSNPLLTGLGLAAGVGSMFLPGGQGLGLGLLGNSLGNFFGGSNNANPGFSYANVPQANPGGGFTQNGVVY